MERRISGGLFSVLPIRPSVNRRGGAHRRPRHVCRGDPSAHAAGGGRLAEDHLGRCRYIKVEAKFIRFLSLHCPGAGVGRVQEHLELVVGCVRGAEGGVVEDPEFLANVFYVNFHFLHGTVENALGFFDREGDLFGHEVAVVDGDPGSAQRFNIVRKP